MKKIIALLLVLVFTLGTVVFAHPFSDVSGHWAAAEIEKGYNNKIINGDGDGKFRPDDNITRGEFLKMVITLICEKFGEADGEEYIIPDEMGDGTHWASKYYIFARETYFIPSLEEAVDGIYAGAMNSPEDYDKPITRWEMAYMLSSSMTNVTGMEMDSDMDFSDAEAVKAYPDAILSAVVNVKGFGFMQGDEKNNFAPKANGTRAEAVTVINRMDDSLSAIITNIQTNENEYNQQVESNIVTYDVIPSGHPKATILMENNKKIVIELYPEYAPQTVANFVKLAKEGFYNNLTFHRVIEGFVAQGGDPNGDGTGGSGKYIKGEFSANGFEQNTLKHERGSISMARSQHYDSATSQFFICYDEQPSLDGHYAAFGKVIQGMEVVDAFTEEEMTINGVGEQASPVKPIKIKSITIK